MSSSVSPTRCFFSFGEAPSPSLPTRALALAVSDSGSCCDRDRTDPAVGWITTGNIDASTTSSAGGGENASRITAIEASTRTTRRHSPRKAPLSCRCRLSAVGSFSSLPLACRVESSPTTSGPSPESPPGEPSPVVSAALVVEPDLWSSLRYWGTTTCCNNWAPSASGCMAARAWSALHFQLLRRKPTHTARPLCMTTTPGPVHRSEDMFRDPRAAGHACHLQT